MFPAPLVHSCRETEQHYKMAKKYTLIHFNFISRVRIVRSLELIDTLPMSELLSTRMEKYFPLRLFRIRSLFTKLFN